MNHTVVGLFNDNAQTQRAVERLAALGVSASNIDVARRRDQGADVKTEPGENQEWVGTSKITDNNLTRFFKSLFVDRDDDMPDRYSRIAGTSHAVVTVTTSSREEAERVADVLDECGAVDIDEHVASGQQNNTGSSAAPTQPIAAEGTHTTPLTGADLPDESRDRESAPGRIRSRSQIISRPIDEDARLRNEDDIHRGDTGLERNRPGASGF